MEQPRRGIADSAIIDWLTFTFPTKNLNKLSDTPITNDGEAILFISSLLEKFVGFGITKKIKLGGKFRFFSENAIPVGLMMFYILMFLLAMILRLFALRLRALVVMLLKRDGNKAFTAS